MENGWVLGRYLDGSERTMEDWKTYNHGYWGTFQRVFEYFHGYQNSNYQFEGSPQKKYSTKIMESTDDPEPNRATGTGTFYKVTSETENYAGVFPRPNSSASEVETSRYNGTGNIVVTTSDVFRFAVKDGVYITDNIFTLDTLTNIVSKFKDNILSNTLTVYNSAVLRTNSSNGKYYQHMDTAYKFWETLYSRWGSGSNSFSGKSTGASSFLNYYDNTFEFPVKNEKEIYIRHRYGDYSKLENFYTVGYNETQNGQIIEFSGWYNNLPVFSKFHSRIANEGYSDYYKLESIENVSYFIGNMKYNSSWYNSDKQTKIDVSSLSKSLLNCTSREQDILNYYSCVGYVVGKGPDIKTAENNRDDNIKSIGNVEYLSGSDWSNVIVSSNDPNDVIVIDFFYERNKESEVYFRHVDLTDYNGTITKSNVDRAPKLHESNFDYYSVGSSGYRYSFDAKSEPFDYYNSQKIFGTDALLGHEKFSANASTKYRVYREMEDLDPSWKHEKYRTCIGTNITTSDTSFMDARQKMDDKLDSGLPSDSPAEYIEFTPTDDITLIEFYYVEPGTTVIPGETDPIDREKVGRLSFYTASPTNSSKFPNVNTRTTSNNSVVYDVIPSGESLTPSIDNAYRYMLGGINIEKQDDENLNHYLEYTVVQPFYIKTRDGETTIKSLTFDYDYSEYICTAAKCAEGYYDESVKQHTCKGTTIDGGIDEYAYCNVSNVMEEKDNETKQKWYELHDFNDHEYKYKNNTGFKTLKFSKSYMDGIMDGYEYDGYYWLGGKNGELEFKVTHKIKLPYLTTFYKVKNIRMYTISKLELLDGYSNAGLPLFDGKTNIVNTSQTYKDLFLNATFTNAKIESNLNRTSVELTPLNVYYNNEDNPIKITTTKTNYFDEHYYDGFHTPYVYLQLDKETTQSNLNTLIDKIDDTGIRDKIKNMDISDIAKLSGFKTTDIDTSKIGKGKIAINTDGEINTNKKALEVTFTLTNDRIELGDGRTVIVGKDKTNATNIATNEDKAIGITTRTETEYKSVVKLDLSDPDYNENVINISTLYPSSIRGSSENAVGSQYLPSSSLTKKEDFSETPLKIPETSLNGKRYSYAKLYYSIQQNERGRYDKFTTFSFGNVNFDLYRIDSSDTENGSSFKREYNSIRWSNISDDSWTTHTFKDTEMHNIGGTTEAERTDIRTASMGEIVWEYGKNNTFENVNDDHNSSKDADVVDVFTPITFTSQVLQSVRTDTEGYVNHTTSVENSNQIQKNARFTIQLQAQNYSNNNGTGYSSLDTTKYLNEYYIKFNFDVENILIYDARSSSNGRRYNAGTVPAETWIGPIYNLDDAGVPAENVKISAFALADANQANALVQQETNIYTVRATAYNIPSNLMYDLNIGNIRASDVSTYVSEEIYNEFSGTNSFNQSHQDYYWQDNILGHSKYIAEQEYETQNLSRVYDFKVTDLKDIDWKNIFRTSTSATTNVHTSKAYYAGIYKWNIYTTKVSEMITREVSEIGVTQQQTLPLGPYKNTNSTYIKAPKLGYKFSFDLKTTGANANKKVVIEPRFYYISKNGTNYTKDIKLFYKNSSNKYVSIDKYNLYIVPNDGYRLTFEGTDTEYRFDDSFLSNATLKLGNTNKITLTDKMMQTADNKFVQIWYGEYKLPNSTIAVKLDRNGKYNINDNLTDGYIGVVFDIKVQEYSNKNLSGTPIRTISYSQDDRNFNGANANTSQWDYEGYLGLKNVGKEIANPSGAEIDNLGKQRISIQLEKGEWLLNNDIYNEIKGTVILYDTDAKASSDYE